MFHAKAKDLTIRMNQPCRNCKSLYGPPCQYYWSAKSGSLEKVCAALYSKKAEENEELQAKLAKAVEDNEKLEKKLNEAVKENEELQQKLIISEQDWQHESNLYSKTCDRIIESERREMNLNAQLDEVHNKLEMKRKEFRNF